MTTGVTTPLRILVLGASYGVILGMRIAAAGHRVTFVCREQEAALINAKKLFLRIPAKDRTLPVEISASQCPVAPDACVPGDVDPGGYDLVCLAMQEPQFSSPGVRQLVGRLARSRIPILSIMNMPLPPFLNKITTMDDQTAAAIFTEPELWAEIDASVFAMASADPQAMRVDADDAIIISATLPTNFKVAPFEHAPHQLMFEQLCRDIDVFRIDVGGGTLCQPRVRLRPHASNFLPLVKWPMLITGNFRCMTSGEPISIGEAVCSNEPESRDIYEWVLQVCTALGVEESKLVPFDRYLTAAEGLSLPSSLARGLHAGEIGVERVDKLIQFLAGRHGMVHSVLDRIVADVNARLEGNRVRQAGVGLKE